MRIKPRRIAAAAESIGAAVGDRGLAGLVNNAGLYPLSALVETSPAQWEEVVAANLRSAFQTFTQGQWVRAQEMYKVGNLLAAQWIFGGMLFFFIRFTAVFYHANRAAIDQLLSRWMPVRGHGRSASWQPSRPAPSPA